MLIHQQIVFVFRFDDIQSRNCPNIFMRRRRRRLVTSEKVPGQEKFRPRSTTASIKTTLAASETSSAGSTYCLYVNYNGRGVSSVTRLGDFFVLWATF